MSADPAPGLLSRKACCLRRCDPKNRAKLLERVWQESRERPSCNMRIAVVGSGIAGALVANKLRSLGAKVVVFSASTSDSGSHRWPSPSASLNPLGIVMPRFDASASVAAKFFRDCFSHAVKEYARFDSSVFRQCGILLQMDSLQEVKAQSSIEKSGLNMDFVQLRGDGLFFPTAGLVRASKLVNILLQDCDVIHETVRFLDLVSVSGANFTWTLRDADQKNLFEGDKVVVAAGVNTAAFEQTSWLPLRVNRGRVSWASCESPFSYRSGGIPPKWGIVAKGGGSLTSGYVAYDEENRAICFGSVHDRLGNATPRNCKSDSNWDSQADDQNLKILFERDPSIRLERHQVFGRTSFRCAAMQNTPIAGQLPNVRGELFPGLFVLTALGSRGFTTGPFLAEYIADLVVGRDASMPTEYVNLVSPSRLLQTKQARTRR